MSKQPAVEVYPATPAASAVAAGVQSDAEPAADQLVEETLVEEVSIDGMCGVY